MAKRSKPTKGLPKSIPVAAAKSGKAATAQPPQMPWPVFFGYIWPYLLKALVIAAAIIYIYYPVFHGGWLMDDNAYVTQNPGLRDPLGLLNIWFGPGTFVEYYPIQETLLWIMWQLWADYAPGYHITSILLHIAGSLSVWYLFSRFNFKLAWLGALLFAVHPVNVESVAWVSELKNTISIIPFVICMAFWVDYENATDKNKRLNYYILSLAFFIIGMLCKITMAPFPFVILLYAWWKRGKITWMDVRGALPFLFVSLLLGITTYIVGEVFAPGHVLAIKIPIGDFWSRLACFCVSSTFYFTHFFFPYPMMPAYPQWDFSPPTLQQFLPLPIMLALFCWFWARRKTWGRHFLLAFGFFFLNLGPFLGFHGISYMRFTWVMDHFMYLPMLGLIGLVIGGLGVLLKHLDSMTRPVFYAAATLVLLVLTVESHNYAVHFQDLETLDEYEITMYPESWLAHNNLGFMLVQKNKLPEAKVQFEEALRIWSGYSEAHNNLGVTLSRLGDFAGAEKEYQAAIAINPDYIDAVNNLQRLHLAMQEQAKADAAKQTPAPPASKHPVQKTKPEAQGTRTH